MGRYSAFAAGFGGAGGGDGVHNGGQDAPEYGVTSRKGFKAKGIVQMVRRARRDENGLVKRTVKNLMKMKLLKKIGVFLSILGAMSVLALGFYLTTNNIYFIDGNPADFSLYGWGGMFAVWAAGVWQWRKGNSFLITFAAQLAVVCFVLDCWRLLIFAYSPEMRPWVKGIIWGEAALLLL